MEVRSQCHVWILTFCFAWEKGLKNSKFLVRIRNVVCCYLCQTSRLKRSRGLSCLCFPSSCRSAGVTHACYHSDICMGAGESGSGTHTCIVWSFTHWVISLGFIYLLNEVFFDKQKLIKLSSWVTIADYLMLSNWNQQTDSYCSEGTDVWSQGIENDWSLWTSLSACS